MLLPARMKAAFAVPWLTGEGKNRCRFPFSHLKVRAQLSLECSKNSSLLLNVKYVQHSMHIEQHQTEERHNLYLATAAAHFGVRKSRITVDNKTAVFFSTAKGIICTVHSTRVGGDVTQQTEALRQIPVISLVSPKPSKHTSCNIGQNTSTTYQYILLYYFPPHLSLCMKYLGLANEVMTSPAEDFFFFPPCAPLTSILPLIFARPSLTLGHTSFALFLKSFTLVLL